MMEKTIHVANMASLSYFVIFIMLKFFLQNAIIDWKNALLGAIAFWVFIFFVHSYLNRTESNPR